jgi:exopolysaccharide biosynthesis polyprenyl glycosylphosphotransferase
LASFDKESEGAKMARGLTKLINPFAVMLFEAGLAFVLWLLAVELRILTGLENAPLSKDYWHYGIVLATLTVAWQSRYGMYHLVRQSGRFEKIETLLKSLFATIFSFIFLIYFLGPNRVSRVSLAIYALIMIPGFVIYRRMLKHARQWIHTEGGQHRRVILIGDGEALRDYAQLAREHRHVGIKVVGWFDTPAWAKDAFADIPKIAELPVNQREANIDAYVVSYASANADKLDRFLNRHYDELTSVYVLPNIKSFALVGLSLDEIEGLPIMSLNQPRYSAMDLAAKRLLDIAGAGIGMIVLSPVFLGIAALIKITSPGPVFFGQERMGLDGQIFKMWKFRTMRPGPAQPGWTVANDPRRTKFGTFLRRTSLDELPQLWNVFVGEMSLVGPRPEQPYFVEKFRQEIPAYMLRHKVKAGITGWAQVQGWRGDTSLRKRIECDLYYIRHWSLWLDIKILLLTVKNGILHDNAY